MVTEKQKQIIELISESKEGYNINQIARLTNSSPSWTYEILKRLAQQGHLIPKQMGNAVFFTINTQNLVTQKIIELIKLETKSEIPKREEKQPKIIQQIEHPTQKYERQKTINYVAPSINQTTAPNFYSTSSQPTQTVEYGVTKANDVQGMLVNYAATGSGGLGYSNNTFSGGNQHYGSSGAPPINTLAGKISKNPIGFTFSQHTSEHNSGSSPGCRYCGPEMKI